MAAAVVAALTGQAGSATGTAAGMGSGTGPIDFSRKSSIARIAALLWRRCEYAAYSQCSCGMWSRSTGTSAPRSRCDCASGSGT
ncbi:hypothetical protein D3C72_1314330 [compost metagenome]